MADPIAEALRPGFVTAARLALEIIEDGGPGSVEVLFGHLPRASISVLEGREADGRLVRTFSMSIPSVMGRPDDPDSLPTFFSGMVSLGETRDIERAREHVRTFEKDGPQILANTVRSCIVGLVRAGIGHEEISAVANEAVASIVMES